MPKRFTKRFLAWIEKKLALESNNSIPPLIREGEMWWCSVGENLGLEVSGKGEKFSRPVIILKKFGDTLILGIPTTTNTGRKGKWYVHFMHKNVHEVAMLTQARVLSPKRLNARIGELERGDYEKIKKAFTRLLN